MRKFFTFILLILVLVLAGITGYVALNLGESPIDFSVADNNCCEGDNCANYNGDWGAGYTACVNGQCSKCQGGGPICGNGSCQTGEDHNTCPTDCPASNGGTTQNGGTTSSTGSNLPDGSACTQNTNTVCLSDICCACGKCGGNKSTCNAVCGTSSAGTCTGSCKDRTGINDTLFIGESCTGMDNKCYQCQSDGSFGTTSDSPCGGGSTTSGSTNGSTGTGSKGAGQTCTPGNNECANPYVCTLNPQNNTYVCNDPGNTDQACGNGYSCTGFVAFRCTQLDSSGRCESGQQGIFSSFSQASATINSCGQVDQICVNGSLQAELDSSGTYKNCGDFQIISSSCSGSPQTATPGGSNPTPPRRFACNSNFQCVENPNGQFTTRAGCEANCVEDADTPLCGDTCQNTTQCPTNHSCTGGRCVLNGCTGSTCLNGCSPLCGGPCSPGNNATCPDNHTCTTQGRCIITQCVNNASCTNNGCTLPNTAIPTTAFGDNSRDYLMLGALMTLIGIFTYRFKLISNWSLYFQQINKFNKKRKVKNFESEVEEELGKKSN
jgi:hypothetical protein